MVMRSCVGAIRLHSLRNLSVYQTRAVCACIPQRYPTPYLVHRYDPRIYILLPSQPREFHTSLSRWDKEPSKVEQTVNLLKDQKEKSNKTVSVAEKKTLWRRIVEELYHYYTGFKLLFIDIHISSKLIHRLLNGKTLTRREHRQLVRTVSDLFRLVPFSVFIIVPFMELLLPVALKLFPNMLPSTFQTQDDKDLKMKKTFKVKLEMAKFLQNTLNEMAVTTGGGRRSEKAREFMQFIEKIRLSGGRVSNEDILKFSKLFEDEITLDNLNREQLVALCRVLEMQPFGTNNFLRFQLRMRLRMLRADDKVIQNEGIDSLTIWELQQACKARGMRAFGISEMRLRMQLMQWLELSLNHQVPPSLMLLSRAMYLPEHLPPEYQLQATIQTLPDAVARQTKAAIADMEGKVSNKARLEVIKEEQAKIKEEKEERKQEEAEEKRKKELEEAIEAEAKPPAASSPQGTPDLVIEGKQIVKSLEEQFKEEKPAPDTAPVLKDKARVLSISTKDIEDIEEALGHIAQAKKKLIVEIEELKEIKEEMADYQHDVDELRSLAEEEKTKIQESSGAKLLNRKVNKLIGQMDRMVNKLEDDKKQLQKTAEPTEKQQEQLVSVTEILTALSKIQETSDETRISLMAEVLNKMDDDHDGNVRVEDVLKVVELLGRDHMNVPSKYMDEVMELIGKEEMLEEIGKELKKEQDETEERRKEIELLEKKATHLESGSLDGEVPIMKPPTSQPNKNHISRSS